LEEYLAQPEALTRIAANGFSLSARIAGEERLDGILDAVAGLEESGRPFREFPEERKALAEVMQYASSRSPAQRRYADGVCAEGGKGYPESIALKLAAGCGILSSLHSAHAEEAGEHGEALLHSFRDAATGEPEAAVLWLNLALLCRHGDAAVAERRFLELALEAPSTAYGGLLVGMNQDPYYGRWRAALAFGRADVELLWAAAAARLAGLHFEEGDFGGARAFAERSIGYCADVAVPHQVLAKVCQEEGDLNRAAEILEESLPLTALDLEHRLALIEVLRGLGRLEEARALAASSERIFRAWLRAAHVAERFGALRATLK
jgi:tetratricopeptide (TPR) repeat protein